MSDSILDIETVDLDDEKNALVIIDQTLLPGEVKVLHLTAQNEIWEAIKTLRVRGAPAIGVAAAFGIYLAAKSIDTDDFDEFYKKFKEASDYLNSSRPTAVNLSWALKRMEEKVLLNKDKSVKEIKNILLEESRLIKKEDTDICRAIGENTLTLLKPGMGLLTHCNAGQLATTKYGTATAAMHLGQKKGYNFKVFCDETRPLLQGARLTAFELSAAGIDTTLICDNMAPTVMKKGLVDAVLVGCDRVAANGDTANKIGTSYVAIAAKRYNIPFYVCAPTSTIDFDTSSGESIIIEQRDPYEVTGLWYEKPMAPEGVKVFNPAFDVTDAELITAIITEKGIVRAPYKENLAKVCKGV
ncbi:MAG: S-methyl-5-thioribose-1-phosphate isomerase [Eubacterium sp.]|nr:S-methyl-5-thioribose-1-phosphate isomerase [Eubacterium sp.]